MEKWLLSLCIRIFVDKYGLTAGCTNLNVNKNVLNLVKTICIQCVVMCVGYCGLLEIWMLMKQ